MANRLDHGPLHEREMSCRYCCHWLEAESTSAHTYWERVQKGPPLKGKCARYPVWTEALSNHWCGEFSFQATVWQQSPLENQTAHIADAESRIKALQEERKTLKARVAALNAKLKKAKAST